MLYWEIVFKSSLSIWNFQIFSFDLKFSNLLFDEQCIPTVSSFFDDTPPLASKKILWRQRWIHWRQRKFFAITQRIKSSLWNFQIVIRFNLHRKAIVLVSGRPSSKHEFESEMSHRRNHYSTRSMNISHKGPITSPSKWKSNISESYSSANPYPRNPY